MSSPFPIPGLTSSPFPFPLPQLSAGQAQAPNQPFGQVPLPQQSSLSALTQPSPQAAGTGIFAPSPLTQFLSSAGASLNHAGVGASTSGTGLTPALLASTLPGVNLPLGGFAQGPSPGFMGITPNTSALLAAVGVGPGASGAKGIPTVGGKVEAGAIRPDGQVGLAEVVQALGEVEGLLLRAESLRGEIKQVEGRVFGQSLVGDEERLLSLHSEYAQTLQTIHTFSQTHLFGSLPLLQNTATPTAQADQAAQPQASQVQATTPDPTMAELAQWAEQRAALEFARREALSAGGKAVVDILRGTSRAAGTGAGTR
ncbi:hypothetical protein IAU60_001174 [Kwoniella sp. DSM 27419]